MVIGVGDIIIDYKVALLTFKVVMSQKPDHLFDLIQFNISVKQYDPSCYRPYTGVSKIMFVSRAFSHATPTVWNRLLCDLSSFNIFH